MSTLKVQPGTSVPHPWSGDPQLVSWARRSVGRWSDGAVRESLLHRGGSKFDMAAYAHLKDGDDWSPAIEAVSALARAASLPIDFGGPGTDYEISEAFDHTDLSSMGYPRFKPVGFTTEAVIGAGSLGDYVTLDADATQGSNRIQCAVLAPLVQAALDAETLFTLRFQSNADFSVTEVGLKQGEQQSVIQVDGDFIYLNESLLDTYTVADGARAAIATIARVDVQGRITVQHSPATTSTQTRGVKFTYCTVRGEFDLRKCRGNGAAFVNCWKPDVRVDLLDGAALGAGVAGYGISIQDCTMYGRFRGVISGGRTATNGSGVNNATGGPSWENHVDVVGHVTAATATFGCHSNVGSMYFDNSTAISGTDVYDLSGALLNQPAGFQSGARRTYIRNCTAIRCGTATGVRGESAATPDREEFVVDGLHLVDCVIGVNKGGNTGHLDRFVARNITGTLSDLTASTINVLVGDIDEWEFDNIHTSGGGLLRIGQDVVDVPTTVRVNGFTCRGDGTTVNGDIRGVNVATGGDVTRVELSNGVIDGMYWGLMQEKAVAFVLNDVRLLNSLQHINPNGFAITVTMLGGSALGARHGDANGGVVAAGAGTTIDFLHVDNVEVDTDPYFVGGPTTNVVTTAIIGTLKTHAGYLGHVRGGASPLVFVLSGSRERAFALAGYGDPNAVVTAIKGCSFTRLDAAAAAGSLRYVNTDGATAWTAYA